MPALNRLIVTIALALIASAVPAQPPDTPRVDTVHRYDTIVVRHTTYVLGSSSAIQKEVAELKGEFYEAALKAVERENSGIGNVYYAISIILIIVAGIATYTGITASTARKAVDRELGQIAELRKQTEAEARRAVRDIRIECDDSIKEVGDIVERAKGELDKILASSAQIGEVEKRFSSIIAIANDKAAALQDITMEQRLKLIDGADAKKAVKHYEELLTEMERDSIPLEKIPTSMHKNVGLNYWRLKRWEKAVKELEVFLNDSPTDGDVLFAVAFALSELERFEEACTYWNRAAQADPDDATAYDNWGADLISMYRATQEGKWLKEAIEKSLRALEIAPDEKDQCYNLACAQALLAEKDKMINSLREAIHYDDKHKKMAREDKDFEAYWGDPKFIALTKDDDEGEAEGEKEPPPAKES